MKSKKLLLIILSAVLVVAIVLTSSIIAINNTPANVYKAKMASAEKYLSDGDYDNAILSLKEAIRKNESEPESYLILADAYVESGKMNLAVSILRQGWERTKSARIKLALARLGVEINENGVPVVNPVNPDEGVTKATSDAPVTISVNDSLLTRFARSTYSDYSNGYTISGEFPSNGVYTVSYVGIDAEFSYFNSDKDQNVLSPNGKPDANKLPTEISVKDLCLVFPGSENGITFEVLNSLNIYNLRKSYSNKWKCETVEFDSFDCHITVEADANGNIKNNSARNIIAPLTQNIGTSLRTLNGRVINVTDGNPIFEATLKFRYGVNVKVGGVDYEIVSPDGNYSLELAPGEYTVEVSANGYMTEFFPVYISETNDENTYDFGLSPVLAEGQIRIVLEWGASPYDLDSHLVGTSSDGTGVNVNFTSKIASSASGKIAELDLDDTNSFGPETTTIYDSAGSYEFRVNQYSFDGSLSTSGAVVKIYMGGQSEPVRVDVPSTISGEWWNVCTIINGELALL